MNTKNNKAFAEVIESSLTGFLAQSWQWDQFPRFGSLITVTTSTRTVIGIVHQIQTGSMDPIRYPFPYQKTEEELLNEQPQIFEFLKTTFSCLTVAYLEDGTMRYMLAPEPVKIHAFVSPASEDISKQFFYNNQYLHVLFGLSHQIFNLDELLLALIKHQTTLGTIPASRIAHFMETFSLLTGNDYRRLKLFLQRVEPLI
ncbi:MAG: hypothetical protein ACHQVS_01955 [Candidatus Babeliales bacterium]